VRSRKEKRKETRITIETERILVVSRRPGAILRWCEECGEEVRFVRPEEAAAVASVSTRAIYRRVEERRIHFAETEDGLLFVCLASLQKAVAEENDR
jgi:hypothetical protein